MPRSFAPPPARLPCRASVALRVVVALLAMLAAWLPGAAQADCIDDAAVRHGVNAFVLRAIGWQESHLDPAAVARNADGSIDRGAFQINSVHLPGLARQGVDPTALADGCVSADVAAWHYRRQVERFGNTWTAVGAYHSRTPQRAEAYANRVAAILARWRVLPQGASPRDDPSRHATTMRSAARAPTRRSVEDGPLAGGSSPHPPTAIASATSAAPAASTSTHTVLSAGTWIAYVPPEH